MISENKFKFLFSFVCAENLLIISYYSNDILKKFIMFIFNRYLIYHRCNTKLAKFIKLSENSSFLGQEINCYKCASNHSSSKFSKDTLDEDVNNNALKNHKSVFGNLRKPLENTFKKNLRNVKVIKIKSRPNFKKVDEADVFGNLSDKSPIWYPDILEEPKIDNDQCDDSVMVRNLSRHFKKSRAYLARMKVLVKEKKLKEALDLFIEMKRNFVRPIPPHYTYMIGACGRAGYTEMAFKLLNQMTVRRMTPTAATLTGLFNSCGECPYPEYGLKKAKLLKDKIAVKNWDLTRITYHAMIKAFGKCGDLQTAFQIVDEMAQADIKIDVETYSFLLMSCVSDKESGFTHAIEVWRKMKEKKCLPNQFSCNLLLRAARECDIGPEEVSCLILQHWSNYLKRPYGFQIKEPIKKEPLLQIQGETKEEIKEPKEELCDKKEENLYCRESNQEDPTSLVNQENVNKDLYIPTVTPSVLGRRPESKMGVLDLGCIKTASDRLALVGGSEGFLSEMKRNGIKPDIKTFTLLLECLPPSNEDEEKLISKLETFNVIPDTGFFNILMKRRILRHENSAAKNVLLMFNQWGVSPDLITFGILAMGCHHYNQAILYLNDLEKLGFSANVEIVGALLNRATTSFDFQYIQHILELMEKQEIQPNEKILVRIDKTLNLAKRNIIDLEHGKEVPKVFKKENFSKLYKEFCTFYEDWLKRMKFEKEENVWSQYRTEIVEKYVEESL